MTQIKLPKEVSYVIDILNKHNHKAYVVGGCVRDTILNKAPNDWDVCTSAKPEEVIALFDKVIETGLKHGTVTVQSGKMFIEVTTFRIEGKYSDNRRPDTVKFVSDLKEDLSRRDFTINALAYHPEEGIIDYFGGVQDLNNKIIKAVGDPSKRFQEDALRILRALRFSISLDFQIEAKTGIDALSLYDTISNISYERIQNELNKILVNFNFKSDPYAYMIFYHVMCILCPYISEMNSFDQQNPYHDKNLWEHTFSTFVLSDRELHIKLAALFHDIGKLNTKSIDEKGIAHYYNHQLESMEIAKSILTKLCYDNDTKEKVIKLINYHDLHMSSKKSVKRMLNKIDVDLTRDLLALQYADILSQNLEFAHPRLLNLFKCYNYIDEIIEQNEAFTIKDLNIGGKELISQLGLKPGPIIGRILDYLLKEVIEEKISNNNLDLLKGAKKYVQFNNAI